MYSVGIEYNNTIAKGQNTLFVTGYQCKQDILIMAFNNSCAHIHLGHNGSFQPDGTDQILLWEELICSLLAENILVSLSVDQEYALILLETRAIDTSNFIPIISVDFPFIKLWNYPATLRVTDSTDHQLGNWFHCVHDLTSMHNYVPKTKQLCKPVELHSTVDKS